MCNFNLYQCLSIFYLGWASCIHTPEPTFVFFFLSFPIFLQMSSKISCFLRVSGTWRQNSRELEIGIHLGTSDNCQTIVFCTANPHEEKYCILFPIEIFGDFFSQFYTGMLTSHNQRCDPKTYSLQIICSLLAIRNTPVSVGLKYIKSYQL